MGKTVLFLSEAGIYPYIRTLSVLGDALAIHDEIYITRCTGQMERCSMMDMYNLSLDRAKEEKAKLCKQCNEVFCAVKNKYNFKTIELSEFIDQKKYADMKLLVDNYKYGDEFFYNDVPVRKLSIYTAVLFTKVMDVDKLTEPNIMIFKSFMLNTMLAAEFAKCILEKYSPTNVLLYNPYSYCQAVDFICKKNNILSTYVTNITYMGTDFSQFKIDTNYESVSSFKTYQAFFSDGNFPIHEKYVCDSFKDAIFRFYGSDGHIFSNSKTVNPISLLESLHLSKSKKTIFAFTSSYDEYVGGDICLAVWGLKNTKKSFFKDQIEWLSFLKSFAVKHKDIQIIVRVHPREGEKHGRAKSEHLQLLENTFSGNDVENFIIIWSDDNISSYDLIELADLSLVGWSTMGIECARIGIPVISYIEGAYYNNSSFMYVAKSVQEYEDKIFEFLQKDYTFQMLRDAVRFNYWFFMIYAIDCSDTLSHDVGDVLEPSFISEIKKQDIYDICYGKKSMQNINMQQLQANSHNPDAILYERSAVLEGVKVLILVFMLANYHGNPFVSFCGKVFDKIIHIALRARRKFFKIPIPNKKIKPKITYENFVKNKIVLIERESIKYNVLSFFNGEKKYCLIDDKNVVMYHDGYKIERLSPLLVRLMGIYF